MILPGDLHVPVLKLLLVLTNVGILLLLFHIISIHFKDRNNYKSFSTAFHVLSLIWLCIRCSFWLLSFISTTEWSVSTFYLLYWMPYPFQFSSFMLLPLFFSQKLYPANWKEYWNYSLTAYITVIIILIVFQIIWTFVAAFRMNVIKTLCENDNADTSDNDTIDVPSPTLSNTVDCYHTEYAGNTFRIIAAFCSLALAIMQGLYGYKLFYTDVKSHEQFIISNQRNLAIVNVFLVLSFFSRAMYQIGAIHHTYLLPDIPLQGDGDVSFTTFICFEIWDYIPTILLLMTVTSKSIVKHNNFTSSIKLSTEMNTFTGSSYPQYGALFDDDDEWKSPSVASSVSSSVETTSFLLEAGTSPVTSKKSKLRVSTAHFVPVSLERFEAPSCLTPSSTWLNSQGKDGTTKFTRNTSFSVTPTNSLENQEKGLMMYYKPYHRRERENSICSDTSTTSDSGRNNRKKPPPAIAAVLSDTNLSEGIRIERSGTIEKDSKSLPSPVQSPKFNLRDNLDSYDNSKHQYIEKNNSNQTNNNNNYNNNNNNNYNSSEMITAIPRPTRSFQVINSANVSRTLENTTDRRFEMKKRESKSVIPDV